MKTSSTRKQTTKATAGIPHREDSRRSGGPLREEVDRIAAAVLVIINSSETPSDLYEKVANWITDATNIQDSQGESLIQRWTYQPETVAACLEWAKEREHRLADAEALTGK